MDFAQITEEVYSLDYENKLELKTLIDKYIIEDRRKSILVNHLDAVKMADNNELKFSSDTNELLSMLED